MVANEVKHLAQQTAEATVEITGRVETIQLASRDTFAMIDEVSSDIHGMEEVAGNISAAVEEQTAATSEIARSIGETAEQAGSVTSLMGAVTENVAKASQASMAVAESSDRMDQTLRGMRLLVTKAVRTSSAIANRRQLRRRAVLMEAEVQVGERREKVMLHDLSERGVSIASKADCEVGTAVIIEVPEEGIRVAGTVVACAGDRHHVRFEKSNLTAERVDALARKNIARIVDLTQNDHLAFVDKIAHALSGDQTLRPSDLATHHTCRLGRWYDTVTDDLMCSLPAYAALAEPHREVHTYGRQVLVALEVGQTELANTRMGELRAASNTVLAMLDRLRTEYDRQPVSGRFST